MSTTTTKPLMALTAHDVMSRNVVSLPENMPLRNAAQLLLHNHVGGAPVVDTEGRCVGVLSAIDVIRLAEKRDDVTRPATPPLPITCSFQNKHTTPDGREITLCSLPPGVCLIQVQQTESDGHDALVCSQPHCVLVDWQIVDVEKLPEDEVRRFMTANPVTVRETTSVRTLARMMVDAHIHRLIVVNADQRPTGIVSSSDLLAAMAYAEDEHPARE